MPRIIKKDDRKLNAYFTSSGFVIEEELLELELEPEPEPEDPIKSWMKQFKEDKYSALFHLGFQKRGKWFSPALEYLHHIVELLIRKISQQADLEISRDAVQADLQNDEVERLKEEIPFAIGMEYIDADWIRKLWESLFTVFRTEIRDYDGTVNRYFAEYNSNINVAGRVFFHLVENVENVANNVEHENKEGRFPFAFMATYSTKPVKSKRAVHTPLKNALEEFKGEEKKLLNLISTVIKAAEKSSFISELLESGELFSPLKLTTDEAYIVLKEMQLYEEAGIMCRVPDWWRKRSNSIRLTITVGEKEPSKVGLDAIMDFSPTFKIGDESLTVEELREFQNMAEGLIQYKGKWVDVSKDKLDALLQAFEKVKSYGEEGELSLRDALRLEWKGNELLDTSAQEIEEVSVNNGQWLKAIKEKLTHPAALRSLSSVPSVASVPSFHGSLRPYQSTGYQWLNQMFELRLGACLADDMGLGKTVQIIAYLEDARVHSGGQALLILPASLIGNWQKEIDKFAPEMSYQILHKSELKAKEEIKIKEDCFLSITTYGMAVRLEELKNRKWDYLILDEAQAIKNPGTKQTKAIKQIPAMMRIGMTGTPIENRLGDLWSLFDFLNQGLLGTAKEFTNFTKELGDHPSGYMRLRKMIQPFILRRMKTDKSIISDLPDKLEMNAYTTLSKKQIVLYQQLIRQMEKELMDAEGIARKGLVLSGIMKFKQICNHPDQYMGREEFKPEQSGKFEQLREICETIREKRERVLVFTQFREMTEPISDFLAGIFNKKGFVLHGGTSVKRRNEIVSEFNGEQYIPYMVLSLKAGGVGLNLTAANHVIHFDRWWNPAVENQATDRAFRIGQRNNVMVHKFVTKSTIEEKIDEILTEKRKLSGDILSAEGEQWITEYNNEELMKLFALGGDKV
ncbi:DEAD/DEAH box helicase [Dehalobacterium formicoaceticum]|uniref:DEAD/DEAH box helicase n=1 Tax=Dehalobacterium formicoaceticum TaxID=51515 RepID=UPI000B7FA001|nr:DEAD/DEAH box helicase [Dehalobacterium formicoaceticum]